MQVELIDPRGDVAPYARQLAAALASAGADVRLLTAPFVHGRLEEASGVELVEAFHRRSGRIERPLLRALARPLEHTLDSVRHRRTAAPAVRHYQWLPYEPVDPWLLPAPGPRVLTLHNVLRRRGPLAAPRYLRALARRFDRLIVHTSAAAERLQAAGVPARQVFVHPHPAFTHLVHLAHQRPLPAELAAPTAPVVLYFGSVRPYKGLDVLLKAIQSLSNIELWIVGRPLTGTLERERRLASRARCRVRFVERYVDDAEVAAIFAHADLVVLPYRAIDQSGVLALAIGFGRAAIASDIGGFGELARAHGYPRTVPAGDASALARALGELAEDEQARRLLGERARALAKGELSVRAVAERLLGLYRCLIEEHRTR